MVVDSTKKEIITALVSGIVWGITYLYIRRYMNPETRDIYMKFSNDAFYGGIAVFAAMIAKNIVGEFLESKGVY